DHRRRALVPELDAGRAAGLELQPPRLGVGEDLEVRPAHPRAQESLPGVPAHAALLVDLEIAAALIVAAVEVVGLGDAGLRRRLLEGVEDGPADARLLDAPLAARAVELVGAVDEV